MVVREGSTRNYSDNLLKVAMNTNDQSDKCTLQQTLTYHGYKINKPWGGGGGYEISI